MAKKLLLTLGLAVAMLGGLLIAVAFADGPTFDLDQGDENLRIVGENALDWLGEVTSGDINNDGVADLIIGASGYDHDGMSDAGAVYAIWGRADLTGTIDLNSSGEAAELTIYGGEADGYVGHAVASGDWNHDGVDDIVIGADGVSNRQGAVYVITGSSSLTHTLYLTDTNTPYLSVYGESDGDRLGRSVAIGDVNGDGWQDLILGAYWDYALGRPRAGTVYVIFGASGLSGTIDLSAGDEADVTIYGPLAEDWLGRWVDCGDVDGDGVEDILIGASRGDVPGHTDAGKVILIYGSDTLPSTIDLATTNIISEGLGLVFYGSDDYAGAGFYVSSGNINGDVSPQGYAYEDLVITAYREGYNEDGEAYVIYGGTEITSGVTITPGTWGINMADCVDVTVFAGAAGDRLGRSAASADFNGDGYDDVLIGAPRADRTATITDVGYTYVIYGGASLSSTINVSPTSNVDILVIGDDADDESGRACGAGDLNDDGVDDLIIGAAMALSQTGEVYAIWGPKATSITLEPASTVITGGLSVAYTVTATNAYSQSYDATNYLTSYDIDGAAGGSWSGNVYTTGNDGTWTVTATHRGLTDTAELLVDGTAPVISEVNVTSDNAAHFYNPGLTAEGGTVYFNSLAGEGADQTLTVVVTMTEANPVSLTGGTAFGTTPPADTNGADGWQITYDVGTEPGDQTDVPFTVTDIVWLTDQAVIDFIEDNVAPTGSVTAPTGPYVNETQPDFTADADDATSGVASVLFQYKLSSEGSYTDLSTDTTSPYQAVWGSEALADGQTYNLRVVVTDNAGNPGASEVVTITCDLSMPTMEPIVETEGQHYNSAPVFSNFGFDDNEDLDDGWYQMDSYTGTWTLLFTDVSGPSWDDDGWSLPGFDALSEGSHTIYFRASDDVGNEVGSGGEWSWQFYKDTTPPTMETISEPQGQYYNSAPVFSNFGFDDEQALDAGWYQIDSYSGTWVPLFAGEAGTAWDDDGWELPGFDGLSEGSHTVYFRARDDAGNEEGENGEWSWQFYKDTTAPTITYTDPTAGGATACYTADPGAVIDVDFGVAGGSDLDYAQYRVGAGDWQTIFSADRSTDYTDTWAVDWSLLAEGENEISIRVADVAGNLVTHTYSAGSSGFLFRKDSLPPYINTVSVNSSKSNYFYNPGLSEDGGTVYFNSVDGQGGDQVLTVEVTMTEANPLRLDGGTAFGSTPSDTNGADGWAVSYTVAAGAGSENGVLFTVTDQGGYTDTATVNFIQDNIAPTATVVTPTGTLTSIGVIQGTATDNSGGAGLSQVELQVTDGTNYLQADGSWSTSAVWLTPSGLANWSYDTSGVTWAETSYTIRVRTTDRVGNVGSDESTFTYEAPAGPMRYIYLPLIFRNY
ncbi:MAG: FG-GAP repeat protein [Anaerolineae bacterium]|nr:FG-GAP repeat protein [Anaerolineae bacterium]